MWFTLTFSLIATSIEARQPCTCCPSVTLTFSHARTRHRADDPGRSICIFFKACIVMLPVRGVICPFLSLQEALINVFTYGL